jgi:hypothetical protein
MQEWWKSPSFRRPGAILRLTDGGCRWFFIQDVEISRQRLTNQCMSSTGQCAQGYGGDVRQRSLHFE